MFNLRKRLQEAPFLRGKGLVEFVAAPAMPESAEPVRPTGRADGLTVSPPQGRNELSFFTR